MKVKYTGPTIGLNYLVDGEIYEVVEVDKVTGAFRIMDGDSQDDFNVYDEPDWKPGALYSPVRPKNLCGEYEGGRFEIVEDDEAGSLKKAIYGNA